MSSTTTGLELSVQPGLFVVCRLRPDASLPAWFKPGPFASASWTADELSLVCMQSLLPPDTEVRHEPGWRCLMLHGPIPFHCTGVLLQLLQPLAAAGVGIFAVSTFDTDYVLVKQEFLDAAVAALAGHGHRVAQANR